MASCLRTNQRIDKRASKKEAQCISEGRAVEGSLAESLSCLVKAGFWLGKKTRYIYMQIRKNSQPT